MNCSVFHVNSVASQDWLDLPFGSNTEFNLKKEVIFLGVVVFKTYLQIL